MSVHITKTYNIGGLIGLRQNAVKNAGETLGFKEMSLFKFPDAYDSDDELHVRMDGIIASLCPEDIVIFQHPSGESPRYDGFLFEHLRRYHGTKIVAFIQEIASDRDDSEYSLSDEITLLNRADMFIFASAALRDYYIANGLKEKPYLIQNIPDYMTDICTNEHKNKKLYIMAETSQNEYPLNNLNIEVVQYDEYRAMESILRLSDGGFVYSPFSIIALQGDVKYAQVEFGEDGNPISIDMFEDGKICRRNYYDDRGFVSSTVIYENGIEQYQDFLMENGIWKIREYKNDGHVVVNQTCPDYDVVPDAKSGKAGEPVEMRFTKAEYDSLEAVIEEVFASYVNLTRQNDNFFVAMHPLHIRVAEHVLKGKRIIATFFENRFDFTQTSLAADFLEHAENIITDSDYTTKLIMENLGAVNNKPVRLNITDIPPYDTRMDFGISSQLRVQNILVPVDGLTEDAFARIIKGLADYLTINDLARVHFFTRDASWGHEDAIKNDTVKLLDSMGYDSRLVTGDGEAALGFGGSGADAFAENELGDIEKTVEQRFFVDVCVDERDISKCINEQRVILDMRGTMDVFVYVTAISKGVPRISLSADQFLVSGKNGMVIDDFSDIGRSLTYYLDSFENWNQALVECYELGQKYTTSVLLKKWRKVLNFSE